MFGDLGCILSVSELPVSYIHWNSVLRGYQEHYMQMGWQGAANTPSMGLSPAYARPPLSTCTLLAKHKFKGKIQNFRTVIKSMKPNQVWVPSDPLHRSHFQEAELAFTGGGEKIEMELGQRVEKEKRDRKC